MESVAAGDGAADRSSPLARYYAESGTPPGRFLGGGLADLDDGQGVAHGTQVTEEHLRLMLVALADPVSGEPVGGVPRAPAGGAPVAGFDLTFSVPLCRYRHKGGYAESRIMPSSAPSALIDPGQKVVTST
jgi:hypothetical protein